jgi:hypothetical protein
MQLLRALIVLVAVAAATGQYLQEHYRLLRLEKVPVAVARERNEKLRRRSERLMLVLAIASGAAGLVALGDLVVGF